MMLKLSLPRSNTWLILWIMLRLPLFVGGIYLLSNDDFIWLITILGIHLIGTLPERIFFFGLMAMVLGSSYALVRPLHTKPFRQLLPLLIALSLFLLLFTLLPGLNAVAISLFLTGVLALNTLPEQRLMSFISQEPGRRIANFIFVVMIGLAELLLLQPLLLWLLARRRSYDMAAVGRAQRLLGWLPMTLLVPGLGALLLNAYSLAELHRTLLPNPAVEMFARGNFNWLALDLEQRILYASGHGTNYLQAYNIDALEQPPRWSRVENGYAEGFTYNSLDKELYVYNELTQHLLLLDATTLALKKAIPTPQISPGDAWVAWDRFSDNIVVASEADEQIGLPTLVINRTTGHIVDTLDVDPGSLAIHPTKPWIYMSFFRRDNELLIYDARLRKIVRQAPMPERIDRMVFAGPAQELDLFVPSPLDSNVLRFDAETLEYKGTIKTLFGARAIAVDAERNLLLCGSLVTHWLEVIDLATHERLAEYYLGPWLRTISLDSEAGIAYVSTHEGLFAVHYAQ